jgi:hypothetical protein
MVPSVECPHCHFRVNTGGGPCVLCPKCLGEFVPAAAAVLRRPTATRIGTGLIFVLVVGICICVAMSRRGKVADLPSVVEAVAPAPHAPAKLIDVARDVELWDAYRADVAAADLKYKGKSVSYQMTERPALVDLAGRYVLTTSRTACRFGPDKAIKLRELAIRPLPRVRGVCRGRVEAPGSMWGWVVAIDDCDIVTDP